MLCSIDVNLHYHLVGNTDLLLQIEAARYPGQSVNACDVNLSEVEHLARIAAKDGIGERVWLRARDAFSCRYSASVDVMRVGVALESLDALPPHQLPAEAVPYLMPSRYCPADEFQSMTAAEFGQFAGGARVAAMRDWISERISYVPGASNASTTALHTFVQRQGVCRDFAHLLITFCRASTIPARFASVYSPQVSPPDFHAVAEVFLDNAWHFVDATGMADAESIVQIGVGMDAAEIPFLAGFGPMQLVEQSVSVTA